MHGRPARRRDASRILPAMSIRPFDDRVPVFCPDVFVDPDATVIGDVVLERGRQRLAGRRPARRRRAHRARRRRPASRTTRSRTATPATPWSSARTASSVTASSSTARPSARAASSAWAAPCSTAARSVTRASSGANALVTQGKRVPAAQPDHGLAGQGRARGDRRGGRQGAASCATATRAARGATWSSGSAPTSPPSAADRPPDTRVAGIEGPCPRSPRPSSPPTATIWRSWLAAHGPEDREIWLLIAKKGTEVQTVTYDEAVEEALCFGWIDGHTKRYDETYYAVRFSPREARQRLGREQRRPGREDDPAGADDRRGHGPRRRSEAARAPGTRRRPAALTSRRRTSKRLWRRSRRRPDVGAPGRRRHRRQYIYWVLDAKRPETRARRIAEVVRRAAAALRPGEPG